MSERCSNCGAELFAGQQFCRRCGAAVRAEDAPTLRLGQGAPTGAPPATTSHLDARGTDPVRDPRPTGYQPPLSAFQRTTPLRAAPNAAPARRRGAWLLTLVVVVAVVSVLCTLALVFTLKDRQSPVVVKKGAGGGGGSMLVVPPVPPDLPARVREAVEASGVSMPLDESGASVDGDRTTFTKTYELDEGGSFSLKNFSGPVTVEGWDEERAEVKIVKRGGTAEQRRHVPVMSARRDDVLALASGAGRATPVSVAYEIKLPRGIRQVEISSESSDVRVSGLAGTVVVDVKAGQLEFRDVTGTVRSSVIKGHTKVSYEHAEREGPQEFRANLGDVEVDFPEEFHADLKAETIDGQIEADDTLGLTVSKAAAGRHVVGRLGEGREPLLIRVVNGDIKLKK